MKLLGELVLRRIGVPAIVLCGGPSLPTSFVKYTPSKGALRFSANGHGAQFLIDRGIHTDYIVSVDHTHTQTGELMEPLLRRHWTPIISPQFWADYRLHDYGFNGNSGLQAIYVAWLMGCSPIVVYGLDCYKGDTYWHSPEADNISKGRPDAFFKNKLRSLHNITGADHIRIAGDGLAREWFPEYVPGERMPVVIPNAHQLKRSDPPTVLVEFIQDTHIGKAKMTPGMVVELTRNEADTQLYKRNAICVTKLQQLRAQAPSL